MRLFNLAKVGKEVVLIPVMYNLETGDPSDFVLRTGLRKVHNKEKLAIPIARNLGTSDPSDFVLRTGFRKTSNRKK